MDIMLKDVRIAFPELFEATSFGEGDPAYSASFVLPPDLKPVKLSVTPDGTKLQTPITWDALLKEVANDKWKDKGIGILKKLLEDDKVAYRPRPKTNSSGEVYDGFEGMHHINSRRREQDGAPRVVDINPRVVLSTKDGRPYGGSYVNVRLNIYAQDNTYGRRINATLVSVQFVRDGDAFGGGTRSTGDEYEDLSAGSTDETLV